jgi:hypothetical protein
MTSAIDLMTDLLLVLWHLNHKIIRTSKDLIVVSVDDTRTVEVTYLDIPNNGTDQVKMLMYTFCANGHPTSEIGVIDMFNIAAFLAKIKA